MQYVWSFLVALILLAHFRFSLNLQNQTDECSVKKERAFSLSKQNNLIYWVLSYFCFWSLFLLLLQQFCVSFSGSHRVFASILSTITLKQTFWTIRLILYVWLAYNSDSLSVRARIKSAQLWCLKKKKKTL